MSSMMTILAAMLLIFTMAFANTPTGHTTTVIGGADGPTSIILTAKDDSTPAGNAETITLPANPTTGYVWTGFVLGGDAVELDSAEGTYMPDSTDGIQAGAGGQTVYTITAVHPGQSIISFSYARSWENEPIEQKIMLAIVDDELNVYVTDVTESGVYDGVVIAVDEAEHAVLLQSDKLGEVSARFDENEALPVVDEHIVIYTNGTMTMSLPPIVNVIAWGTVPGDMAR